MASKNVIQKILLTFGLIALGFFLYLYKLDYEYFFVDEVVYVQAGSANLRGDFSLSREVAPIGKYLAGFSSLLFRRDTFFLRLPFALLAIMSSALVYLIIKNTYGYKYAFLGAVLFLISPFIHTSSRMVMLEPIMHFFWLACLYFYFKFITLTSEKVTSFERNLYLILTGLALGMSLATKVTSFILIPFMVVVAFLNLKFDKKLFRDFMFVGLVAVLTYAISHIGIVMKEGPSGVISELQNIKDKYFANRDQGGKEHVVGNNVYNYSPWWYYFYYLKESYPLLNFLFALASAFVILLKKDKYIVYWTTFLMIDFGFFQLLGVKAPRYISSIEIPLVFLTVALVYELSTKIKNRAVFAILIGVLISTLVFSRSVYLRDLKPTKYNALKLFLMEKTHDLTIPDRTFVYGSIRSGRWPFEEFVREGIARPVVVRRDRELMCEYDTFKYLVSDRIEELKDNSHPFYDYIKNNEFNYEYEDVGGLDVYIKKADVQEFVLDASC